MNLKYLFRLSFFVAVLIFTNHISSQTIFDQLKAQPLEGSGTLMNAPATFKMSWSQVLNNTFYHLDFQNERTSENNDKFVFKAKAFYKVSNDSLVSGTWFDSRGVTFPLTGTASKTKLTIIWGTPETEQGKTIYTLTEGKSIQVQDFFFNKEKYFQFGDADYSLKKEE